jgi:hypothetical protein
MTRSEYFEDPLVALRREFPNVGILRTGPRRWIACFGRTVTISADGPAELREKLLAATGRA